jgi:hypothetical protein
MQAGGANGRFSPDYIFEGAEPRMTQRTRKLAGTIVLLLFLSVYALVAMLVAVVLQVNASKTVELIYYVVAGLLWVLPAGALITWMQRPDEG